MGVLALDRPNFTSAVLPLGKASTIALFILRGYQHNRHNGGMEPHWIKMRCFSQQVEVWEQDGKTAPQSSSGQVVTKAAPGFKADIATAPNVANAKIDTSKKQTDGISLGATKCSGSDACSQVLDRDRFAVPILFSHHPTVPHQNSLTSTLDPSPQPQNKSVTAP